MTLQGDRVGGGLSEALSGAFHLSCPQAQLRCSIVRCLLLSTALTGRHHPCTCFLTCELANLELSLFCHRTLEGKSPPMQAQAVTLPGMISEYVGKSI